MEVIKNKIAVHNQANNVQLEVYRNNVYKTMSMTP